MPPKKIQLTIGMLTGEAEHNEEKKYLEKPVMMVYTGKFASMDGDVEIKDEDIDKLVENHNSFMSKLARMASGEIPVHHNPPLQLDHSTSAHDTVGRLVGPLSVGEHIDEEGQKHKALMGKARILGADNIEKVKDGRWAHVSIGADLETHKLTELSITPFPAAANASLLSKKTKLSEEDKLGYKDLKEKMAAYEKCRKHLTEHKKMSEEDADKHLEKATDDELTAMSKEADDHLSRMAEEDAKRKEEEAKKSEEAKMAKAKENKAAAIKLSKEIKAGISKITLGGKATVVHQKITRLRAAGKITPAEIKRLGIDDLAAKSDDAVEAALKTYDERQPVIDVGLYGTTKAMSGAQLHSALKNINMAKEELQTRLNMPSKRDGALKRLAELEAAEKDVNVHIDNVPQGEHDVLKGFDEAYEMHRKLTAEGKHDEAKEHLKSYMKSMTGPVHEMHAPNVEPPTAAMSALAAETKSVQDKFVEFVKLTAPAFGATFEEM